MNKPDWSKAPKGATHWGPETKGFHAAWYIKQENGLPLCFLANGDDKEWAGVACLPGNLIHRPTKPRYIAHYGGECPVPRAAMVEAVVRDGTVYKSMATGFSWGDFGTPADIIAYRVLTNGE